MHADSEPIGVVTNGPHHNWKFLVKVKMTNTWYMKNYTVI